MRDYLTGLLAVLSVPLLLIFGLASPLYLIGSGLEDFEGGQKRMAAGALIDVESFYGSGFLEIGDYNGPPLVLGWHVTSVEGCPNARPENELERNSYRSLVGARAEIGAYTLFGIPRGEMRLSCAGRRIWEPHPWDGTE